MHFLGFVNEASVSPDQAEGGELRLLAHRVTDCFLTSNKKNTTRLNGPQPPPPSIQASTGMDTSDFYAQYAQVLGECHANRDDLLALLDPEAGFAPRLRKLCKKRCGSIAALTSTLFPN